MKPKNIAVTLDAVIQAIEADEGIGFCAVCGYEHVGIEPDARKYKFLSWH